MSKSDAKKLRLKHEREGTRNPQLERLSWNGVNPVERKTPTLAQRKQQIENKHKKRNQLLHGDDSFFCVV